MNVLITMKFFLFAARRDRGRRYSIESSFFIFNFHSQIKLKEKNCLQKVIGKQFFNQNLNLSSKDSMNVEDLLYRLDRENLNRWSGEQEDLIP